MKLKTTNLISLDALDSFAEEVLTFFSKGGIIGLTGDLGSGKTTLVRAIIKVLSQKKNIKIDRVISPSFVLHQSYEMLIPPVHHFDLYRMDSVTEMMLVDLEYYEIVEQVRKNQGFLFVEWPELCVDKKILKLTAEIKIEIEENCRRYKIL